MGTAPLVALDRGAGSAAGMTGVAPEYYQSSPIDQQILMTSSFTIPHHGSQTFAAMVRACLAFHAADCSSFCPVSRSHASHGLEQLGLVRYDGS